MSNVSKSTTKCIQPLILACIYASQHAVLPPHHITLLLLEPDDLQYDSGSPPLSFLYPLLCFAQVKPNRHACVALIAPSTTPTPSRSRSLLTPDLSDRLEHFLWESDSCCLWPPMSLVTRVIRTVCLLPLPPPRFPLTPTCQTKEVFREQSI